MLIMRGHERAACLTHFTSPSSILIFLQTLLLRATATTAVESRDNTRTHLISVTLSVFVTGFIFVACLLQYLLISHIIIALLLIRSSSTSPPARSKKSYKISCRASITLFTTTTTQVECYSPKIRNANY